MIGLTPRQVECLDFITTYVLVNREGPTVSEIADGLRIVRSAAYRLLCGLKERGRITWLANKPRSIALTRGMPVDLAPDLLAQLVTFCAERDEDPSAVLADALTLHMDQVTQAESIGEVP